jgi:hypothetical protein
MKEITVRCRWETVDRIEVPDDFDGPGDTITDADDCWLEQVQGPPGGSLVDWEKQG